MGLLTPEEGWPTQSHLRLRTYTVRMTGTGFVLLTSITVVGLVLIVGVLVVVMIYSRKNARKYGPPRGLVASNQRKAQEPEAGNSSADRQEK